jgi:glutaredoxin
MADIIVYTLTDCPTCIKLKRAWKRDGVNFEERAVDKSQVWMDEALDLADMVPIIWRNGEVELGFKGEEG